VAKGKGKSMGITTLDSKISGDENDDISEDWDQDEMQLAFKKSRLVFHTRTYID
jgi:hypothetical protein